MIPTAAATAPAHVPGWLILTAAALILAIGYAIACWLWPYGFCRRCDGSGKRMSPSGRHFRLCRRCKGTARRLRIGRRIHNYLRHATREGADR